MMRYRVPGQLLQQTIQLGVRCGLVRVGQDLGQRQTDGIRAIDHGEMAVGRQGFQRRLRMAELVAD